MQMMVLPADLGYNQMVQQLTQVKRQLFPDEFRAEGARSVKKAEFREVTYENFEDICTDLPGFCMIAFLPAITQIEYELEGHN